MVYLCNTEKPKSQQTGAKIVISRTFSLVLIFMQHDDGVTRAEKMVPTGFAKLLVTEKIFIFIAFAPKDEIFIFIFIFFIVGVGVVVGVGVAAIPDKTP